MIATKSDYEIVEDNQKLSKEPVLTVKVSTYNHDKYIRDCLEGIVMQKTNFPFEVVLKEDCSSDNTRQIVLEYQKKYPHIFRLYLAKKTYILRVRVQEQINSLEANTSPSAKATTTGPIR